MTENIKIEIALSKSKLTKLLVFSILFLFAGLWIMTANPQTGNLVFNNPFVKAIAADGGVLMGLLGIYFFGRKLWDNKPGFVIDEAGIYDNTSAFNFGFIPRSDISGLDESTVHASIASRQHFVTIKLVDPTKYIVREKNALKRKLLSVNANSYGSPVHISTNGLTISHDQLVQLLTTEFAKYKQQKL